MATIFTNILFTLSGVASKSQMKLYKIHNTKTDTLCPITSTKQLKSLIRSNNTAKASLGPGTSEGALLQKQLLKECQKTSHLIHLSNLIQNKHQRKRKSNTSELQYTNQETQEIQSCLLSLCEENTLPQEETDLYKLIQHQQQQQQKLKQNLVLLLTYMKRKQRQLQLQTGLS